MPDDEKLEQQPEQPEDLMDDEEDLDDEAEGDIETEGENEAEGEKESLEAKLKEAIEVQVDDLGPLRKKLTITVPRDTISGQLNDQYSELRREAQVPGFRKGRAPRRLLEKRFGSEVNETLVQQMVTTGYTVALDKAELKVIGDPLFWTKEKGAEAETLMEVSKALDLIELPAEGPLQFSCEVEIRPEFALPELKGIPIKRLAVTITDEDVAQSLDRLRALHGEYETLADGEIKADDVVIADVKMSSGGTVLKEQEAVRFSARPQVVDGVRLEKLGEVLAGAKAGDIREISGTIPDDYIKVEYRGQQADFQIKVREVQRMRLAPLDDGFAQALGFDSLDEVREWIRGDLQSRLGERIRQGMIAQLQQYLIDNTNFELPERFSERQISRVVVRRMLEMFRQGVPPAEVEKVLDELRISAKADVARELKLQFVMDKLGEEFDVEVSEGEINGLIAAIAQRQARRFDRVRDELTKEGGLVALYVQIRDEKIMDQLLNQAQITDTKPESGQADSNTGGAEAADKAQPEST